MPYPKKKLTTKNAKTITILEEIDYWITQFILQSWMGRIGNVRFVGSEGRGDRIKDLKT